MKKKLLLFTSCVFIATSVFTQQLDNNGFETWNNMGTYEDPQAWGTLNVLTLFGEPIQTEKDTDAHTGTYSAKVTSTTSAFLGGVFGLMYYSPDGEVKGAFAGRPTSMDFYYKYAGASSDQGSAQIRLTKWDTQNNVAVEVGSGIISLVDASAFTLGTVDITYASTDTPDSIEIIFSATNIASPVEGSILNVDDVALNFVSNASVAKVPLEALNSVYPNPAKDNLYIKTNDNKATSIEITDLSGRTIDVMNIKGTSIINIAHLNDGNYLYNLKDGNVILSRGKFSVVK